MNIFEALLNIQSDILMYWHCIGECPLKNCGWTTKSPVERWSKYLVPQYALGRAELQGRFGGDLRSFHLQLLAQWPSEWLPFGDVHIISCWVVSPPARWRSLDFNHVNNTEQYIRPGEPTQDNHHNTVTLTHLRVCSPTCPCQLVSSLRREGPEHYGKLAGPLEPQDPKLVPNKMPNRMPTECQVECPKVCQTVCGIECQNMSDSMWDRMSKYMSDRMQDKTPNTMRDQICQKEC